MNRLIDSAKAIVAAGALAALALVACGAPVEMTYDADANKTTLTATLSEGEVWVFACAREDDGSERANPLRDAAKGWSGGDYGRAGGVISETRGGRWQCQSGVGEDYAAASSNQKTLRSD